MSERRDEKDEMELIEHEAKSRDERQWDEKYRRDSLRRIVWPLIFTWAGLVLLAANLGLLDRLVRPGEGIEGSGTWSIILLGAGVIVLLEVAVRLVVPEYRRSVTGSLIFAVILIGLGLGNLTNWGVIWPLILILLGISLLLRGFLPRR